MDARNLLGEHTWIIPFTLLPVIVEVCLSLLTDTVQLRLQYWQFNSSVGGDTLLLAGLIDMGTGWNHWRFTFKPTSNYICPEQKEIKC